MRILAREHGIKSFDLRSFVSVFRRVFYFVFAVTNLQDILNKKYIYYLQGADTNVCTFFMSRKKQCNCSKNAI